MKSNKRLHNFYGYYGLPVDDKINIIIQSKGYGKCYHEIVKTIKNKLLKDKKELIELNKSLEFINDYKKKEYPPIYDTNKYLISYIDNLIEFLEVKHETK